MKTKLEIVIELQKKKKQARLNMHFYERFARGWDCNSRRSRYSNFRQGLAWYSGSRNPLSLSLSENNSIVIYSRDCWPLGQGRDERFSFYFPFIATGKHRAGDDVISSREGSCELKPPAGTKHITSQWLVTLARFFFTTAELRAITRSCARKKLPGKNESFLFGRSVGKLVSKRQLTSVSWQLLFG